MRVRNKPWALPMIEKNPQLITTDATNFRGHWDEKFAKKQPIHIEVGMGKGQFIIGMAKAHPDINYIGIDVQVSVAAVALRAALEEEQQLTNLFLVAGDGEDLTEYFNDGEIDQLYLNFSDPWPKTRHEKRRLTYKTFLDTYKRILRPEGRIEFKTDNRGLFEFSLTSLNNYGMIFEGVWLNLHDSDENEGNVETEYEQKFSAKGQPIYKLAARFQKK
ncbi:tRNA (guanosine(46)-N7)-methyltransferase TrmB [Paucilactobacillus nenjiangensis]|uniref:tRNA (guanosine(46)-N7)-methyltransferase TrmB n=1 Tax=Paucilactobacillus nenjiangensis TaxID=1296540 RepID=UPI0028D09EC7|nr:tRNA (guanosine(46)-N7)-methyltransferase TrmB [Paucilactobacillus nenjiangensis]